MRHSQVIAALLIILILGAVGVGAAGPTFKPGATVVMVQGVVEASGDAKTFKPVKLGGLLKVGQTLRTQAKASAGLVFSDGTQLRLRENTQIAITENSQKNGDTKTLLSLTRGFLRLVAHKLKGGDTLEVQTPNAVAAVKGTDFDLGFEKGRTEVKVWSTEKLGVVLSDLKREIESTIKAGQGGGFGDKGLERTRDLSTEELRNAQQELKGLLGDLKAGGQRGGSGEGHPNAEGEGEGNSGTEGGQGAEGGMSAEEQAQFTAEIDALLAEVDQALAQDARLEGQERLNDAYTGGIYYDRFGYMVMTSHSIQRPDAQTVVQTHVSDKLEGPNSGQHIMREEVVFNREIPDDWWNLVYNPALLNDYLVDLGGAYYPYYYKVRQQMLVMNPWFDNIRIDTFYDAPSYNGQMLYATEIQQGYHQFYVVNGLTLGHEIFANTTAFRNWDPYTQAWDYATAETANQNVGKDVFTTGAVGDRILAIPSLVSTESDSYWHIDYFNNSSGQSMFTVDYRVLDPDTGATYLVDGYIPFLTAPGDLRYYSFWPNVLNMTFNARGFTDEIDLLFEEDTHQNIFPAPDPLNSGMAP